MSDLATFLADADQVRVQFAALTQVDPTPQVAESLLVLREAGAIALPELRRSITSDPEALIRAVEGPLAELVMTASQASLPTHVVWGNVASVIASAAEIIAEEKPAQRAQITAVATAALRSPHLADAWTGAVGPTFRRTTCCQVTAREEGHCADCVRLTRS